MTATADLAPLAIIADVPEAAADRLIAQADSASLKATLQAAVAAAATRPDAFSATGKRRLATFARRLAKHHTARQGGRVSGLGRVGAVAVVYPRTVYANAKPQTAATSTLNGLGSWLSSAFQSITGTSLTTAVGAIAPVVAAINPAIGAALMVANSISAARGAQRAQQAAAGVSLPTAPQQQAAQEASRYSITAPNGVPARPVGIPTTWVPMFIETLATGQWKWRWDEPQPATLPATTQQQPAGQSIPWEMLAMAEQTRQQPSAGSGIDTKTMLYIGAGLAALMVLSNMTRGRA